MIPVQICSISDDMDCIVTSQNFLSSISLFFRYSF